MAVSDDDYLKHDQHFPTENLILPKPRRHFRTTIHAIHWQLRSLIGAKGQNIVYYVTGDLNKNIQRLNTTTLEAETIKRLPFSPRCLVAENGWICCGGEFGDFAAIQLQDSPELNLLNTLADLEDPESTPADELVFLSLARARSAKNLIAESKKFGKDLVNCITLWFPSTLVPPFVGAYTEPMAVLSNNDKTVTIIRLQSQETDQVISYPDCVNRAIISPDGRLLVAITDDPYLYLHERVVKHGGNWGPFRGAERLAHEWKPSGRILLRFQSADAPTTIRGSFAACFSSTGKYLAVGTQSATISLFNVEALTKPAADPLITCFFSSRGNGDHGAVRDMAFAPGRGDLLAWTEDRGHVGIVDLRNGLISQQVVALDNAEDFEHITISDRSTIDPRILDQRGSDNLISSFASTMDLSPDSRAGPQDPRERLARYISPLSREETSVLEAITAQRRRQREREERGLRDQQLGVGVGNARSTLANQTRSGPGSDVISTWLERRGNAGRTVNEIMGVIREQRERMREARDSNEAFDRLHEGRLEIERRRVAAGHPPAAGSRIATERRSLRMAVDHIMGTSGSGETSDPTGYTPPYAIGFDPSSFTTRNATNSNSNNNEPSNSNNDSNSGNGGNSNTANSGNASGTASNSNRPAGTSGRAFANNRYVAPINRTDYSALTEPRPERLGREWEENPTRRIERYLARGEMVITDPYDTSGLAWSEDGQILFVGADDGIFELHLNQQNRKTFSSIGMR